MTGRDWKAWWNDPRISEADLFQQVGRTVGGVPTGEKDLETTAGAILAALRLTGNEVVLDLCCGNGLISRRIAPHCRKLIALDYSKPLIEISRRQHAGTGIEFAVADVAHLSTEDTGESYVDAIFMAHSFMFFDESQAAGLFRFLRSITDATSRLFLESIPDQDRMLNFYDTPERLQAHHKRKAEGTEIMVNWWTKDALVALANSEGFLCRPLDQNPDRINHHYRFDALLTPLG
jgi:cyclopropane fatty-acyl-phospholipid synthase-like methyltransferase